MISLNYAKKIGDKYILNFYADTNSDLANFDATKEFMFYGVPAVGSTVTVTTGNDGVNYYLNNSGEFVKIGGGGSALTSFIVGQTITGIDFGNVQNGDTSSAMDAFLAGLTYSEGMHSLVTASDDSVPLAAGDLFVMSSGDTSGYVIMNGSTGTMLYSTVEYASQGVSKGYQNIESGKHTLSGSAEVATVSEAEGWNGILIGAVTE